MRGDPQVELKGAVLVGRRIAPAPRVENRSSLADQRAGGRHGEMVTVSGIVLRIGSEGLTVLGPNPDVVHTVLWQRVMGLDGGEPAKFEDGSPARSIHVELDDRKVQFLLPAEVLNDDRLREVNEIVRSHVARRRDREPRAKSQPAVTPPAAMSAPDPEPEPEPQPETETGPAQAFVAGPFHGQTSNVILPPPPPRSKVAMPPAPTDAGSSAVEPDAPGPDGSGIASTSSVRSRAFPLPLAVPPARRVELPGLSAEETDPSFPGLSLPGLTDLIDGSRLNHLAPLLPPPPPLGSWSRLPPAPATRELPETPRSGTHRPGIPGPETEDNEQSFPVPVPSIAPSGLAQSGRAQSGQAPTGPAPSGTVRGESSGARHGEGVAQHGKRTRRKTVLGAGFVLVLAIAGGAIFGLSVTDPGGSSTATTRTTLGPSTRDSSGGVPGVLTGPSNGVDPRTVAGALNIVTAGLPRGWEPGKAPWSRVATARADSTLAGCLGLPVAQLAVLTGGVGSAQPRVYPSGWLTSPGAGTAGFESAVVLNQAVGTQESGLATLDTSVAASCLQGWFASLDTSGDAIVGVPAVASLGVTAPPGETAAGFRVSVVTRPAAKPQSNVSEELVVIGAGRVEVGLVSESIGAPVSASIEATQIHGLESRLKVVATS